MRWIAQESAQIAAETLKAYRRIDNSMSGQVDQGTLLTRTMIDGASRSIASTSPTWVIADDVRAISMPFGSRVDTSCLVGAGDRGFILFDAPICETSLGGAGSLGIAPVHGLVWWAADLVDHTLVGDVDHPELVVVHALSPLLSPETPWSPRLWGDAPLTDLGMFPIPLHQTKNLPAPSADDLAPAIAFLMGFGAAVQQERIVFDTIAGHSGDDGPAPRRVATVVDSAA